MSTDFQNPRASARGAVKEKIDGTNACIFIGEELAAARQSVANALLLLAAHEKRDAGVQAVCELAGVALLNIKDRYLKKERMGATGEELKALQALVDVSRDFWMRQSGELFRSANLALDKARGFVRERVAA